jgi:hypothetical protein
MYRAVLYREGFLQESRCSVCAGNTRDLGTMPVCVRPNRLLLRAVRANLERQPKVGVRTELSTRAARSLCWVHGTIRHLNNGETRFTMTVTERRDLSLRKQAVSVCNTKVTLKES